MKAIIIDDDPMMLTLLETLLNKRAYDVQRYTSANLCPIYDYKSCDCPMTNLCADVIITDLLMPFVNGVEFIERLRQMGCKCKHIAMMSGSWTEENLLVAGFLKIEVFLKPLNLTRFEKWLTEAETDLAISPPT